MFVHQRGMRCGMWPSRNSCDPHKLLWIMWRICCLWTMSGNFFKYRWVESCSNITNSGSTFSYAISFLSPIPQPGACCGPPVYTSGQMPYFVPTQAPVCRPVVVNGEIVWIMYNTMQSCGWYVPKSAARIKPCSNWTSIDFILYSSKYSAYLHCIPRIWRDYEECEVIDLNLALLIEIILLDYLIVEKTIFHY